MRNDTKGAILAFVFLVSLTLCGWVVYSYFEARAYNRVTGADITTAEAMFLQLRVESNQNERNQ